MIDTSRASLGASSSTRIIGTVGAVAISFVVGWLALVFGSGLQASQLTALALLLSVLTALPFALPLIRGQRIELGEPIYLISILYFLYFPFRAFYVHSHPGSLNQGLGPRFHGDFLVPSLICATVGFVGILVGYYVPLGKVLAGRIPRLPQEFRQGGFVLRALLVSAVGLGAWAFLIHVVGRVHAQDDAFQESAANNLVIQLSQFTLYGTSLLAIRAFKDLQRGRRGVFLALLVAFSCNAYVSFAQVIRVEITVALLGIGLAYHYAYRRLSGRVFVVAVVVVVLFVFPLIGAQRVLNQRAGVEGGSGAGGFAGATSAFHVLTGSGVNGYLNNTAAILGERFHGLDSLAAILKYTPSVRPYQYGKEYLLFVPPFTYVPRTVWHGKPSVFNEAFGPTYFGRQQFTDTHIAITNIGDLYMNFWWVGVIVGCFVLGALYRTFYAYAIERCRASGPAIFVYTVVLAQLILVELEIATPLSQLVRATPFVLAIIFVLVGVNRRSTSA